MRCLALAALALICAACGPQAAQTTAAQSPSPAADAALPFPTIDGATSQAVLANACAWAKDHYRAPQRATADTPVTYRTFTGIISGGGATSFASGFDGNVMPAALGFRQTFIAIDEDSATEIETPSMLTDVLNKKGLYRLDLSDRTPPHDYAAVAQWCPVKADQGSFTTSAHHADVCLHVTRTTETPATETLEHFDGVPVAIGNHTILSWSGYRWSGNGGALVLSPQVRAAGDPGVTENTVQLCPDLHLDANGSPTAMPDYLNEDAWLDALAPAPPPSAH